MLDKFTSMQVFVNAVTLGSISAAAREAKISPAMAARHIDALEERFGTKLLLRSTRKLNITEVGQQYLQSCRVILQEIQEMEADITADQTAISGKVVINAPLSFGIRFLAPLVPKLTDKHPNLVIDIHLTDSQYDLLSTDCDLTIRIGQLTDSDMRSRKLGDCRMHLCAAPSYWQQHGRPEKASDLTRHNCLSYTLSANQSRGVWVFGAGGDLHIPVSGNLTANNGDALVAAASQGLGVIYQPDFIVNDALAHRSLESVPLKEIPHSVGGIHVVFNDRHKIPARVRATIDFLAEYFQ